MKTYFLYNGTADEGPFTLEELKTKSLTKDTPVWFEGLEDWTTVEKVDELKDLIKKLTPPPFKRRQTPPPFVSSKVQQTAIVEGKKGATIRLAFISVIGIVVLLTMIGISYLNEIDTDIFIDTGSAAVQEKPRFVQEVERSQPEKFLIAEATYKQGFLSDKLKVKGMIKNSSKVAAFKDAVIRIIYYSKAKEVLETKEYTISQTFPPNSSKPFELKITNVKDVSSIDWKVITAKETNKE